MANTDHCEHPTGQVVYHQDIDDDGREFEDYWCRVCNRWIPPGFMDEIRSRSDWTGWLTENDL